MHSEEPTRLLWIALDRLSVTAEYTCGQAHKTVAGEQKTTPQERPLGRDFDFSHIRPLKNFGEKATRSNFHAYVCRIRRQELRMCSRSRTWPAGRREKRGKSLDCKSHGLWCEEQESGPETNGQIRANKTAVAMEKRDSVQAKETPACLVLSISKQQRLECTAPPALTSLARSAPAAWPRSAWPPPDPASSAPGRARGGCTECETPIVGEGSDRRGRAEGSGDRKGPARGKREG